MHSAAVALMQTARDVIVFGLATYLTSRNKFAAVAQTLIASGGNRMRSDCDQHQAARWRAVRPLTSYFENGILKLGLQKRSAHPRPRVASPWSSA
jgi:hypothetical protein